MSNSGHESEVDEAAADAQKETFANLRSWTSWGSTKRETPRRGKPKGKQTLSKFSGHWLADDAVCCIKAECPVYTWDQPNRVDTLTMYGDDQTHLKFEIAGGSDALQFVLRLRHLPTNQTASIHFMAWPRTSPPQADQRQVPQYSSPPAIGQYTFSNHLVDVEWIRDVDFHPNVENATNWDFSGAATRLAVNWSVEEEPIGIKLGFDPTSMPPASQKMFRSFDRICTSARNINLFVRGHFGLDESWPFFSSQPCPTPPPWWRYSEVMLRRQSVLI